MVHPVRAAFLFVRWIIQVVLLLLGASALAGVVRSPSYDAAGTSPKVMVKGDRELEGIGESGSLFELTLTNKSSSKST
jgi:hypothetical protein